MLCALKDYLDYRRNRNLYDLRKDPIMKWSFQGRIPDQVVDQLQAGDTIFVFTGSSMISWAVMYMTNARISHVCTYTGDRTVTHATTGGVVRQPLYALYGPERAFLVCHLVNVSSKQRKEAAARSGELVGSPFSFQALRRKFVRIIFGTDKPYYRLRFLIDLTIVLLLLDIVPIALLGEVIFVWLLVPYSLIVVINFMMWSRVPIPFDENYAKPVDIFRFLMVSGGEIYANPQALQGK